jgi:hypothetical protein
MKSSFAMVEKYSPRKKEKKKLQGLDIKVMV